MPCGGVEPKPPWISLPQAVREAAAELAQGPVVEATTACGGYAPSPTFRLRLADGRRAFLKCCPPTASQVMRTHFGTEIVVYTRARDIVGGWAPRLLGHRDLDDWGVLLLEDLGPSDVPPWSAGSARAIMRSLGQCHESLRGRPLPDWLEMPSTWLQRGFSWHWTADPGALARRIRFAGGCAAEAADWFAFHGPQLGALVHRLIEAESALQFLHGDIRSDNLRWRAHRLYLLDWSLVVAGPVEFDVALFAQSIAAETDLSAQDLSDMYNEATQLDSALLTASVCAASSFFFDQAWQEELPGFPRLRTFQRRQRAVCFGWMLDRLGIPAPPWVLNLATEDDKAGPS
jgi:hypothetical protein